VWGIIGSNYGRIAGVWQSRHFNEFGYTNFVNEYATVAFTDILAFLGPGDIDAKRYWAGRWFLLRGDVSQPAP